MRNNEKIELHDHWCKYDDFTVERFAGGADGPYFVVTISVASSDCRSQSLYIIEADARRLLSFLQGAVGEVSPSDA